MKVKRIYNQMSQGKLQTKTVEYTLLYNHNKELTNVLNENGYTIEKDSECFDYFNNNKHI